MKAIFSRVRHPSHPGRGHGSLTYHMTQFERSDWLRSENFTNIMIEWAVHVPAIPHQCPSTLTHQTGLAPEMKSDWSSLQHTFRMEALTQADFILPRNNLKASSTCTDFEFWQTCWAHFQLCSVGVNWTRVHWKAGLDKTVSTTPDVVTGSHQRSKFDTVVANLQFITGD